MPHRFARTNIRYDSICADLLTTFRANANDFVILEKETNDPCICSRLPTGSNDGWQNVIGEGSPSADGIPGAALKITSAGHAMHAKA